jgi:outer membrane protein TolC
MRLRNKGLPISRLSLVTSLKALLVLASILPGLSYADPFKEMVLQILEKDALLRGEKLSIEAEREKLKPQTSIHLPEVVSSASTTRTVEGSTREAYSNVNLTARAVIFNGGHDSLVREEAKVLNKKLDLESAKKDIDRMAMIAGDLLEMIGKQQSITERGRWLSSKRAILENTESRYKKGLLAGEEWLRVKLDFDNAQNQFESKKDELILNDLIAIYNKVRYIK